MKQLSFPFWSKDGITKTVGKKLFGVLFTKRDGTERKMLCKLGITDKDYFTGGGSKYDTSNHLVVIDMKLRQQGVAKTKCWRAIRVDSIKQIEQTTKTNI